MSVGSAGVWVGALGSTAPGAPGDAEVEHLHDPVVAHHHVLGLDVAVDEPAPVGGRERARHVGEPADAGDGSGASVADRLAQRAALDELHDDVGRPVVLADVEDGDGVRVVERRGGARLAEEARVGRGVPAAPSEMTLSATRRPSRASCARYTVPIPPCPISASMV